MSRRFDVAVIDREGEEFVYSLIADTPQAASEYALWSVEQDQPARAGEFVVCHVESAQ